MPKNKKVCCVMCGKDLNAPFSNEMKLTTPLSQKKYCAECRNKVEATRYLKKCGYIFNQGGKDDAGNTNVEEKNSILD